MKYIDLRSDTVTMPTYKMRQAMSNAEVGDDVYEDDTTIIKLEKLAAATLGKEAALFTPSGTMANQLAVMTHTKRGDEIILGRHSHIVEHEVGAAAVLSQVSYAIVDNIDQSITSKDVEFLIRGDDVHFPHTGLLCLENALSNGTVIDLDTINKAALVAKNNNIPVHLDGARIFNASTYLKVDAKDISKHCDSVMFCISKGLCAPVGSILCGSHSFIKRARRYRKLLGGGMRQAGILAAAGIISLENMTKRLHIDHENARFLAQSLANIENINLDINKVHINMVFFEINKPNFNHNNFVSYMLENNIKINSADNNIYRFVTHNDITKEDLEYVINKLYNIIN